MIPAGHQGREFWTATVSRLFLSAPCTAPGSSSRPRWAYRSSWGSCSRADLGRGKTDLLTYHPHFTNPCTVGPRHRAPVRVGTPVALSRSAIASNDSRSPPFGFRRSRFIRLRISASPGRVPNGLRPSHRPVSRRLRTRAARSLLTRTLFSNCATAPSTCRIRTRVGSSSRGCRR